MPLLVPPCHGATTSPLKISTGPKNRCSFLSPAHSTPKVRSRGLTAPRFARPRGAPPDRRALASGQYSLSFSFAEALRASAHSLCSIHIYLLPAICDSVYTGTSNQVHPCAGPLPSRRSQSQTQEQSSDTQRGNYRHRFSMG